MQLIRAGSDTISGGTTYNLLNARDTVCLASDGTSQWLVVTGNVVKRDTTEVTTGEIAQWTVTSGVARLNHTTQVAAAQGGPASTPRPARAWRM